MAEGSGFSTSNLTVSKIVANPTAFSWSQVYSAGKLFASLSLQGEKEEESLSSAGKDIFEALEQEFFTLENKDLESIKNAVSKTLEKIPEGLEASLTIATLVKNILYLYVFGEGRVAIKRKDMFGVLLDGESNLLKSSSGFLEGGDLLILETKQFKNNISEEDLIKSIGSQTPQEIAETLAPLIHQTEEGGASALILGYQEEKQEEPMLETPIQEIAPEEAPTKKRLSFPQEKVKMYLGGMLSSIKLPTIRGTNHSKKLYLTIFLLILIVFVTSIIFAIKKQNDAKTKALFNQIYTQAQKKYDEGQGLIGLNQNLANQDFLSAKDTLTKGEGNFSKDSKEEKQILDLLAKVENALAQTSGINSAQAKQVDQNLSSILSIELKNTGSNYFTQDDKNTYFISGDGVVSVDKTTQSSKVLIKASDLPQNIGGLGIYYGNIYVLDKTTGQILKFVQSNGFSKTNYFDTPPSLSDAKSLTIDGSIWILLQSNIEKFTKGKQDPLSLSGLDNAFSNPTRVFTSVDINNLYVLDNGNQRIIVFDKNGLYKAQYKASVLKDAKDFEVLESSNKIYVLSGGKVFQIDIK